jgi:hypothetical protein
VLVASGSFDCVTHDGAVLRCAQDDKAIQAMTGWV